MDPFKHHVLICAQRKPDFAPSCRAAGAEQVLAAINDELGRQGLGDDVLVTTCGCLGLCQKGPNLVVYPEAAWYAGVKPDDARTIVRQHLKAGRPVEALLIKDPAATRQEITGHQKMVAAMRAIMEKAGALPEELNQLTRGFMESRVVLTAIELDLFTAIGDGATVEAVAKKSGASVRGVDLLLHALASLELIEKQDDRFRLKPLANRFLRAGGDQDSRLAAMHAVGLWPRWSTLTDCVKAGTSLAVRAGEQRDAASTQAFIAAMHRNANIGAGPVAGLIDLTGVHKLLDLGGGSGAYAIAFTKKQPGLDVTVFDQATVIPLTQGYVADAGLAGKINFIAGDMLKDDYGAGYDLIFVSAICHMWGPEQNLVMLKKIYAALKPGGRVILQDFILKDDRTGPSFGALFSLNMLVNTKGGKSYSRKEYFDLLDQAGFKDPEHKTMPAPTGLIVGWKK